MIIVLYHNIIAHRPNAFNMLARPDWLTVDEFDEEIASLAERFALVSLDDIATAVREGRRIPRACAVTFDDGYLGAYTYGTPVLEKYGATGAYFFITQLLREGSSLKNDYFDRLEAQVHLTRANSVDLSDIGLDVHELSCDACKLQFLKLVSRQVKGLSLAKQEQLDSLLRQQLDVTEERQAEYLGHEVYQPMNWDDVANLRRRGHVIGSHSRSHRALSQLKSNDLECEVAGSFSDLRARFNVDSFPLAYPFGQSGHYNSEVVAAARKAGYSYALTAIPGINDATTDPFELHRATVRDLKKLRQAF